MKLPDGAFWCRTAIGIGLQGYGELPPWRDSGPALVHAPRSVRDRRPIENVILETVAKVAAESGRADWIATSNRMSRIRALERMYSSEGVPHVAYRTPPHERSGWDWSYTRHTLDLALFRSSGPGGVSRAMILPPSAKSIRKGTPL